MEMTVNIVRMIERDQIEEFSFGNDISLKEKLAIGFVNPKDFDKLGLVKSLHIKLSNKYGEVIISQVRDEKVPEGIVLMPVSIWSNQITGVENGSIIYKNLRVEVEPTRDPILQFKDLIAKIVINNK